MSHLMKTKQIIILVVFLFGLLFSQSREYVESVHENGMPKIVTVVKESKNRIIVMKRTYWYETVKNKKKAHIKTDSGMENGHIGIKKVYGMLKGSSKMENYMECITGTMIVEKNSSRKSLRTAYGMGKVFNGMKKVGSKLRVSMLMVNDLVSGSFIMKIDL